MYKQYWNDYEKRAEQIRKAARAVETGNTAGIQEVPAKWDSPGPKAPVKHADGQKAKGLLSVLERFDRDDILLAALLFVLLSDEDRDMTMIVILGYLLISGF